MAPKNRVIRALASIKLAVIVIVALAISLAVATTLESNFDTPTAQFWVYRSWWFKCVLSALGVNILFVMVDRWPWKPRHLPFLLAHVGILTLLLGSWMTERFGIDASMRISEGETSNVIDIDQNVLSLVDNKTSYRVPVRWIPPDAEFKPIHVADQGVPYDLTVDRYISRAEANYDFVPAANTSRPAATASTRPAVEFEIVGGLMRIRQAVWLWTGHPTWNRVHLGPAEFRFGATGPPPAKGQPSLVFTQRNDGSISYSAMTTEGVESHGTLTADKIVGSELSPGWKGGVTIKFLKYLPDAIPSSTYKPARQQYGKEAPPSALHLIAGKGGDGAEVWLGMGEHAVLETGKGEVEVGYTNRRLVLPFGIKLNRFTVENYQGSRDPSSYRSDVTVVAGDKRNDVTISMNEPLHNSGVTFYQASYEEGDPRPTVSIFSVNRDPGRPWKYAGSLMIVLGAIVLFAVKYRKAKPLAVGQ